MLLSKATCKELIRRNNLRLCVIPKGAITCGLEKLWIDGEQSALP